MKKILKKGLKIGTLVGAMTLAGACGKNGNVGELKQLSGGIVGGTAVATGDYPSVVGIVNGTSLICTGNLVAKNKITTAAHCVTTFEYQSERQITEMISKVLAEVLKLLPSGSNVTTFRSLSQSDQRRLFKMAAETVLRKDLDNVSVYFGNGTAALGTSTTGQDLVASVDLPAQAMEYAVAQLLLNTVFATPEDERVSYHSSIDYAYLRLKRDVENVPVVPLISADEHQDNVRIGGKVTLVGFGLKMDPRLVEGSRQRLEQLRSQLASTSDESAKADLQAQVTEEQAMYRQLALQYLASGNKNKVDVKIENYDHTEITLKRPSTTLQGACMGDSGGPAFVRLANGSLRQLGVIVTVDYCGNKTNVSPLFDR